ncbi:type II toxin-antitoxin system RelE/ParE family toxin [Hippea alviniae]|nr:type II toxin-antitoxin system RelE/ParE family toxin [Hippea alviniae]
MNKKYKIVWTNSAVYDIESIIEYIAKDNPSTARSLIYYWKK